MNIPKTLYSKNLNICDLERLGSHVPIPRDDIIQYLEAMNGFAMSLTRDRARADDIVQDTVMKAWENIDKFQAGTNMRAWLFTILRNTFYSERRKAARQSSDFDGKLAERMAVKPNHDGVIALAELYRAIKELPVIHQEALNFVGEKGLSYNEAADLCRCAPGTVKSRTSRARRKLREILAIEEGEALCMTDRAILSVVSRDMWA